MIGGYYQELTLLPQHEVCPHFIWSKVFPQIHLGLVKMKDTQGLVPIGISFPEYRIDEKFSTVGNQLRLFAREESLLIQLDIKHLLRYLIDYVHYTGIRPVQPSKIKNYGIYQRWQPKINKERLARRYAKRHHLVESVALSRYAKLEKQPIAIPFIRLQSLSTHKVFCLWIKKTIISTPSFIEGRYSTYGLSPTASVPEF